MKSLRNINELDYQTGPKVVTDGTVLFDRRNLDGYTKRQLKWLIKRHAPHAVSGNFWSFQVANSAAARRVFGA